MQGPHEEVHRSRGRSLKSRHDFLEEGRRYRVVREFEDFDRDHHFPGEQWIFLGATFLPYDDGLSLFVSLDGVREWQIRMRWQPDEQGGVLDSLASYVIPAGAAE